MAEYIERESLEKDGWYLQRHVYGDGYAAIETKPLKEVPSADVRPVVRARWEEFGEAKQKFYSCSNCFATLYRWDNYCPNCGADMREES